MNTAETQLIEKTPLLIDVDSLKPKIKAKEISNILNSKFLEIVSDTYNIHSSVSYGKATLLIDLINKDNLIVTKSVTPSLKSSLDNISDIANKIFNSEIESIACSYASKDYDLVSKQVNNLILQLLHIQLLIRNNIENDLGAWYSIVFEPLNKLNTYIDKFINYVKPLKQNKKSVTQDSNKSLDSIYIE